MYLKYRDRAEFLFVYIREKRPKEVPQVPLPANVADPKEARVIARRMSARICTTRLKLTMPAVLDRDNAMDTAYQATPDRLFVIGKDGKVAYKGQRGPMYLQPEKVEAWLDANT